MPETAATARARYVPPTRTSGHAESAAQHALADRALAVAYRTALGITRDPHLAGDIAQDVAIKALRHASSLREPRALDAWLHRTTVRTAIDQYRRRERQRTADTRYVEDAAHAHAEQLDPGLRSVIELLAPLPYRQRAAMTLRYVHDLTDREIARALGCRTGTARSLLSRATAALRAEIATPSPKDPR